MIHRLKEILLRVFARILRLFFSYPSEGKEAERFGELDGIRGWAALSVLICHTRYTAMREFPGTSLFFHIFARAEEGVNVFFILSGDALSSGVTRGKPFSPLMVLKRIFRLSGTVTIGLMVLYILKSFDLVCATSDKPIKGFDIGFACTYIGAIQSSFLTYLYAAWVGIHIQGLFLDEFLWSMAVELQGSVLVFAICSVLPRLRHKFPLLAILTIVLTNYYHNRMRFFVWGICLGLLRGQGFFKKLHNHELGRKLMGIAVLCIPLFYKYPEYFLWLHYTNIFNLVKFHHYNFPMLVVFLLYASKDAIAFMRGPVSRFLGDVSFCLYVTHHHVMASLFVWLVRQYEKSISDPAVKNWISLVTWIAALVLAAVCFRLESLYLKLLDRAAKLFLANPAKAYVRLEREPLSDEEMPEITDNNNTRISS